MTVFLYDENRTVTVWFKRDMPRGVTKIPSGIYIYEKNDLLKQAVFSGSGNRI